jgi:hypothetical protein
VNYKFIFDYKDGVLYWKNTETRADYLSRHGTYYVRLPNKSTRPAANIVWEMHENTPERFLENITGNLLDYSIENLVPKGTKNIPDRKFLNDRFYYEEGSLYFRSSKLRVGAVSKEGYLRFSMAGRIFGIHQLVWIYHYDYLPKMLDHINGDKLDNRIENLRECTAMENAWNTPPKNSRGFPKGVCAGKHGGFQVKISCEGICKSYGTYQTLKEAKNVSEQVYKELHGEFCRNG